LDNTINKFTDRYEKISNKNEKKTAFHKTEKNTFENRKNTPKIRKFLAIAKD